MTEAPSPFSKGNPKLQRAWDATSLKALMTCPRMYEYSILRGFRSESANVHTAFGGLYASAVEVFKKARLKGLSKEDATLEALKWAMLNSGRWDEPVDKNGDLSPCWVPWGGRYEEQWHCLGTEPYKNKKGNKAKCPFAHKGQWFPEPGPSTCGECGSETEHVVNWVPDDPAKDRYALIRLVCGYCDEQDDAKGLQPYAFPNGQPAVELSFQIPFGNMQTPYGEPYILCGHMDSIVTWGGEHFIADNKTTGKTLSQSYWGQYGPNVQVDLYDMVGSLLYPDLDLKGVIIEGAQTLVGSAHFGIHPEYRSEAQREEYFGELQYWILKAEEYAANDYWPMNRSACYLCSFKKICSIEASKRETFLKADFAVKKWNPLEER